MEITINHIQAASKKRSKMSMQPECITIHSTGNEKSTAQNERDYLTNPINTNETGYHYVVDDKQIIECIPPSEVAWHAGDGRGNGNMKSIGIEICESGDRAVTLKNTIWLIQLLMKRHNINKVVRHYDWSKKICPRIMYDQGSWQGWKAFHKEAMDMDKVKAPHWGQVAINQMKKEGLITSDKDPIAQVTWAEFATVINRVYAEIKKIKG